MLESTVLEQYALAKYLRTIPVSDDTACSRVGSIIGGYNWRYNEHIVGLGKRLALRELCSNSFLPSSASQIAAMIHRPAR